MDLTTDHMRNLFVAFNTYLQRGLGGGWDGWKNFCSVITSKTLIEKYPLSVIKGAMREWVGERKLNELEGKTFEVMNRDFEHTESVSRNDIEDDNIGFYEVLFTEMGISAASLWPQLAAEALTGTKNGRTAKTFLPLTARSAKPLSV